MEYPQGLNIVASITEPGIRSRIPLICEDTEDNIQAGLGHKNITITIIFLNTIIA